VVVAQPATISVERQLSVRRLQRAIHDELPAFALFAEPQVLDLQQYGDRERVVDRGVVDVAMRDTGFLKGARTAPDGARVRQVDATVVRVLRRLAVAEQLHLLAWQIARNLGADQYHGPAAVGDDARIESM
jgi:hypothetical protein